MTMRIAAYVRPENTVNPTGVGKHQIHMIRELGRMSDVELSILMPRHASAGLATECLSDEGRIPVIHLPWSRRLLEMMWTYLPFPTVDRWLPKEPGWIYCPFEMCVPTRRHQWAATFHCVNWFEKSLPWYGLPDTARSRRHLGPVFRRCLARADRVFTVSHFLQGRIAELFGVDPARMTVVGNGVEDIFRDAGNTSSPDADMARDPYVMVVAPLTARKGAEYVLAAAEAMQKQLPSVRIQVVGGKKSEAAYLLDASKHPNVELLDYLDRVRLAPKLRSAVALLLLSRYETFGIPALEAMAAGVPVIAARLGALPEVVGEAGILVDPDRPVDVVAAVRRLVSDLAFRRTLIQKGRERVRDHSWAHCARRVKESFEAGMR